ncbi:MAG: hypothetical protein WCK58_13065 [Chloroflexota bacterium]
MSTPGMILAKVGVFVASVAVGAVVATVVVAASADTRPTSSATEAPKYLFAGADTPAGPGPVVAFNEEPSGSPQALATPAPVDLNAAAAALLGGTGNGTTAKIVNPTGFPRIPPITQFDGGPFQGANCTLASGSMLARLTFGIVTSGSTLRPLQDDQEGGTGLNDLATALWRGYGVSLDYGMITPATLKRLLAAGYGAVIQGMYGEIPAGLRLQRSFTGGHSIYVDGYYPGNASKGIPEAYYVIDPIGRPRSGYEGDWWPASVVDRFTLALSGGDRLYAMWGFPPGGSPPEVVGPDVLPIPPDPSGPAGTPEPGATPTPTPPAEAGDADLPPPPAPLLPPVVGGAMGGLDLSPFFDICLITPAPAGCPTGLEAVFDVRADVLAALAPGPTVTVLFVDSPQANTAIVGFTVDPPATADVKFWEQGSASGSVQHASSMTSADLFGQTVLLARLDVRAATSYAFQAVAGDGLIAGTSDVGTFSTGSGVEHFDVVPSSVDAPPIKTEVALSPYIHLSAGGYALPLVPTEASSGCSASALFGSVEYCIRSALAAAPKVCPTVDVSWTLSGIDADGVLVRAYPATSGVLPDGTMTLDGVIEASGAAPSGTASVGCLASGMTYTIAIDATGDDRGILATQSITVP